MKDVRAPAQGHAPPPPCVTPAVREDFGNPPWEDAEAHILVVRLSPFRDVNRSLPHLVLFSECRRALPRAFIDLAFLPERRERQACAAQGLPWFRGAASGRSAAEFDLLLVSNAFTLELVNLPYLFSTAGLPLSSAERAGSGVRQPLAILGGSNALAAGAIVDEGGDSLCDGLFFGEGEGAVGELALILTDRSCAPDERLRRAAVVPGFWPVGSHAAVQRRTARPVAGILPPSDYPVLNSGEAATARLQITHGCPAFCSFCLQGWDRKPYREVPLPRILDAARELKRRTGASTLEVYSFNFNMHTEAFALLLELNRIFRQVNFMSQRADFLARTPALLRSELAAGKRSFTVGVEGISARMRAYYRKSVPEADLQLVLREMQREGVREIKLFYILAGTEDAHDVAEFAGFVKRLRDDHGVRHVSARVIFSFGYLVRLPYTPLQFESLQFDATAWERAGRDVREAVESQGFEFRFAQTFEDYAAEQVLALGGSALAEWMRRVPQRGHTFDGTLSPGAWADLNAFARARGLLDAAWLGEKPAHYRPPLGFVANAVSHERLYEEFQAARTGIDARLCLGASCAACGACIDEAERQAHTGHAVALPDRPDFASRVAQLLKSKTALVPVYASVNVPAALAGSTAESLSSWLLRALFRAVPEAADSVLDAKEALFTGGLFPDLLPFFEGKTWFAVFGADPQRTSEALARAGLAPAPAAPAPDRVRVEVVVPRSVDPDPVRSFRDWLAGEHVAHTLVKRGPAQRFEIPQRDVRRHVVLEASARATADAIRFDLVLGRKARLQDWLRKLASPASSASVRIRVTGFEAR